MPVKMASAQVVVMEEKVYMGGGVTEYYGDHNQVFQYDPSSLKTSLIHIANKSQQPLYLV